MSQAIETAADSGMRLRRGGTEAVFPGFLLNYSNETRESPLLPVVLCVYNRDPFLGPNPCGLCGRGRQGAALDRRCESPPSPRCRVTQTFSSLQLAVSPLTVSLTPWPLPGPASSTPADLALGVRPSCRRRELIAAGLVTAFAFPCTVLSFSPDYTS